jgi:hypothetical protein
MSDMYHGAGPVRTTLAGTTGHAVGPFSKRKRRPR